MSKTNETGDTIATLRALLAAAGPGEVQANLRLITALHLVGPALVEVAERAGDLYGLSPADITYTRLDLLDAATEALRAVDLSAVGADADPGFAPMCVLCGHSRIVHVLGGPCSGAPDLSLCQVRCKGFVSPKPKPPELAAKPVPLRHGKPLSAEAREARKPLPVDVLAGCDEPAAKGDGHWRPSRHLEATSEGPYIVNCSIAGCADPTHTGGTIEASARYLDAKNVSAPAAKGDGAKCGTCGGTRQVMPLGAYAPGAVWDWQPCPSCAAPAAGEERWGVRSRGLPDGPWGWEYTGQAGALVPWGGTEAQARDRVRQHNRNTEGASAWPTEHEARPLPPAAKGAK